MSVIKVISSIAPAGTFEEILRWVQAREGTSGRHTLSVLIVMERGMWTETHLPQPPKVLRRP